MAGDPPRTILAADRLNAINAHLSKQEGQVDWLSKVEEVELRKELARIKVVDDRGIMRQTSEGKLWVRERIEALIIPGTWREMGSTTSSVTYGEDGLITSFVPSNNLIGTGYIGAGAGQKVVVLGDDFSVRGGHADGVSLSLYLRIKRGADGVSAVGAYEELLGGGERVEAEDTDD